MEASATHATPEIVDRETFDAALARQVKHEKGLTRLGDAVSAMRRRLPMAEIADYAFDGPNGKVGLGDLFGPHEMLLLQSYMFGPEWETGCPSCAWSVDNLPANMGRLADEGIAYAIVSQAPVEKLEALREAKGWDHTWVSSFDTTFHYDWNWTTRDEDGNESPQPGYSYLLRRDGKLYVTYVTRARGTEAILPVAHIMDRTVYGRQQAWEDSPAGWPLKS